MTKGPLSSVANGGRYSYGTAAAHEHRSSTNYFVDPVFLPSPTAAPVVRLVSPGDGATSVPVNDHLQVTFNTDIQAGSTNIAVRRSSDGTAVPGNVSSESQGAVVSFVPSADLDPGTKYTVVVSGARNLAGTGMGAPSTTTFTTSGASACPCSLLESTTQPGQSDSGDGAAVTAGAEVRPDGRRLRQGDPLLPRRRQHGHPHRGPLVGGWRAVVRRDLHRRSGRLADSGHFPPPYP